MAGGVLDIGVSAHARAFMLCGIVVFVTQGYTPLRLCALVCTVLVFGDSTPPTPTARTPAYTTMLKVVGVLIKLSARDHRIGLMNWYHGCVETTPPEQ